jgi:hypothetical protein
MKREFKIFIIIFQKYIIFYTLANVELTSKALSISYQFDDGTSKEKGKQNFSFTLFN